MTAHEFFIKHCNIDGHPISKEWADRYYMKELLDKYDEAVKNGLELRLFKLRGGRSKIGFAKPNPKT
jgi:hypothetical protein